MRITHYGQKIQVDFKRGAKQSSRCHGHPPTHPPTYPGVALVEAAVEFGRGGEEAVEVRLHAPRVLRLVRQLV